LAENSEYLSTMNVWVLQLRQKRKSSYQEYRHHLAKNPAGWQYHDFSAYRAGNNIVRAAARYLFASQAIRINTCLLLLFFRQIDKTCQPFDDADNDW